MRELSLLLMGLLLVHGVVCAIVLRFYRQGLHQSVAVSARVGVVAGVSLCALVFSDS